MKEEKTPFVIGTIESVCAGRYNVPHKVKTTNIIANLTHDLKIMSGILYKTTEMRRKGMNTIEVWTTLSNQTTHELPSIY